MNVNIDTERLITEVHLRPPLWDLSCELYKDRDAKLKAWNEVCQAIIPNFDDLPDKKHLEKQVQQRWKTARDAYVRCKATLKDTKSGSKGGNKKKYVYFDCMQFLEKKKLVDTEDSISESQNTNNEIQSNNGEANTINEGEGSLLTPSSSQTATQAPPSTSEQQRIAGSTFQTGRKNVSKRKRSCVENDQFEKEMLNIFKENTKLMQNDDMSFFCSLLPMMQTFSTHQKLIFRSEVLKKAIEISTNSVSFNENRPGTSHTFTTSSESQDSDFSTLYSAGESTFQSVREQHSEDMQAEPSTQQILKEFLNFERM